jgi:hypothetical protein
LPSAGQEKENLTMNMPSRIFAVALLVAAPTALAGSVNAAPIGGPLSLHDASSPTLQTVQWRGGRGWGWGGRGWGWGGAAAGLAAGAIVGGAFAAAPYYGYDYGYYGPGYYGSAPDYYSYGYAPGYQSYGYSSGGGDAAYCAQRYRSYDPASGTYLGYDGIRHPCS